MANVQHSSLTDPNLHEPKGISSASANQLYLANGSGSGTWTNANRFPGTGWGKYTNTTYVGATTLLITDTQVLLPFTTDDTVSQLPITYTGTTSGLMNLSTETLQFIAAGDLHALTVTFKIAAVTGSPAYMNLILYGSSDGVTYGTILGDKTITLSKGANQVIVETSQFPVTTNMVSHGAKIYVVTNQGTATLVDIGVVTARIHKAR